MRGISLLVAGAALASCSMAPPEAGPSARTQMAAQRLLAGKVAGPPMACISSFRANDMTWIDPSTVAFRQGSNRVYVNHFNGGCDNYNGHYAMVTRQVGTSQLCRGEIAQLIDPVSRYPAGTCIFGDFIPYRTPGTR